MNRRSIIAFRLIEISCVWPVCISRTIRIIIERIITICNIITRIIAQGQQGIMITGIGCHLDNNTGILSTRMGWSFQHTFIRHQQHRVDGVRNKRIFHFLTGGRTGGVSDTHHRILIRAGMQIRSPGWRIYGQMESRNRVVACLSICLVSGSSDHQCVRGCRDTTLRQGYITLIDSICTIGAASFISSCPSAGRSAVCRIHHKRTWRALHDTVHHGLGGERKSCHQTQNCEDDRCYYSFHFIKN